MFLKEAAVKKLIKQAYKKSILFVANLASDYVIYSGDWIIKVDKRTLPNKVKGAIIELTGELPEQGERKQYGPESEYEPDVDSDEYWEKHLAVDKAVYDYTVTNMLYERHGEMERIIQSRNGANYAVPENRTAAVKYVADLKGPFGKREDGGLLIWYDDDCIFAVCTTEDDKEKEILKKMEGIKLPDWYLE